MESGEGTTPDETPGGSIATSSTISEDVLKDVLTENQALLATAGCQPDEDAGSGKQVALDLVVITTSGQGILVCQLSSPLQDC